MGSNPNVGRPIHIDKPIHEGAEGVVSSVKRLATNKSCISLIFSNSLFRNKLVNKLEINIGYNIRLCLI